MEDTARICGTIGGQSDDFVVRQFLGARIERLLLTRLFDLTTGTRLPEEAARSTSVAFRPAQTIAATDRRKGAA